MGCYDMLSIHQMEDNWLFVSEFGRDPRNLRLGLATDGMNPYGYLSSKHSSWPVFANYL